MERTTQIPSDKEAFLSNKQNKQLLINILAICLADGGIQVRHAGDEGDADVLIVQTAVQLSTSYGHGRARIIDTSCKARHTHTYAQKTTAHQHQGAQLALGPHMCKCLPFVHAMSGCDTTSALFGMGKVKHMKAVSSSQQVRSGVEIFGQETASKKEVAAAGEMYVASLYKGGNKTTCLDELRYLLAISLKYIPPERMPPTSNACYYHLLRVHIQVNTWEQLKTVLDPREYGFRSDGTSIIPIITDKEPAPRELLKDIRCSCRKQDNICRSCSCTKMRIPCSVHCKCQGQCDNGTIQLPDCPDEAEPDDDDEYIEDNGTTRVE